MKQLKRYLFVLVVAACSMPLSAQQSVHSSGGTANGDGGNVTYSVGQVVYSLGVGDTGTALEGVQQPWEISVQTALPGTDGILLNVSLYPNPVTEFVTLSIADMQNGVYSLVLFDNQGKTLESIPVNNNEMQISMNLYAPAMYFLTVRHNDVDIKTFRIIKN